MATWDQRWRPGNKDRDMGPGVENGIRDGNIGPGMGMWAQ